MTRFSLLVALDISNNYLGFLSLCSARSLSCPTLIKFLLQALCRLLTEGFKGVREEVPALPGFVIWERRA